MPLFFFLITFIFGTFVGSFLNVIILRFNTGRSAGGRSKCMSCSKTLRAHELIPVFSYVLQGGRCRTCKSDLSPQYPIVEALMGFLFTLVFWKFRIFLVSVYPYYLLLVIFTLLVLAILTVIFFYDIKHKIIPNVLSLAFIVLSFFAPFIFSGIHMYHISYQTFLAGPIVALPLFLLWLYSRGRWLGFGDVKLAIGIGYFLGISSGFAALMISFWVGAAFGILLILLHGKKYGMKTQIPFAPFLVIGFAIAFFTNATILSLSRFLMQ